MAVPNDWSATYAFTNGNHSIIDVRMICPACRNASTFAIRSLQYDVEGARVTAYLLVKCNYFSCSKTAFVLTSFQTTSTKSNANDPFYVYPAKTIDVPHPSVPVNIAEDWSEAQRAHAASAPKAAAVMLRRVLYDVLIDKKCKLHPLKEGMQQLISEQRLPGIFDEWLPAIRDDGHDGAHPDRALNVSTENIHETMEYTAELLRFLYIEPFEFQQRKARNANASTQQSTP